MATREKREHKLKAGALEITLQPNCFGNTYFFESIAYPGCYLYVIEVYDDGSMKYGFTNKWGKAALFTVEKAAIFIADGNLTVPVAMVPAKTFLIPDYTHN